MGTDMKCTKIAYRNFPLIVGFGLLVCCTAQGQFTYTDNADRTVTITGYTGAGGSVTVPQKINGRKVSAIGDWAFNQESTLKSITLPNTVTRIGDFVFENCSSLASINFGNGLDS